MALPLRSLGTELVAEELEKPLLDKRTYRVVKLPNQLEALIIHDPETDKAAAAMDVNVGSFSDSDDMPGIAHAVEHLLFMGTTKFPKENDYSSYLTKYAGYSNAFTASTSTNYYFELSATSTARSRTASPNPNQIPSVIPRENAPLFGALDRFSQFFINPLFLEDSLDRELRAVDSENKKNLQSDMWRLQQLSKSTASKGHPYHRFSTGSYKLLHDDPLARGVKIRDEFINFYKTHYSANRMKLTVLGIESLDELESWVQELFSDVPNQNLPQQRWDGIPAYDADVLGTQIFAKPVMDSRYLHLTFPYLDEAELYASQPVRYLRHLIGHEGPGSILAYLKEKGWAYALAAGSSEPCPGTAFFSVSVTLTEEGLVKYPEILKAIFQYIAILREQPPQQWIVDELSKLGEVAFKFKQKSPASRTVSHLSALMQEPLPRKWLLSGQLMIREFDPQNITRGLQCLRPDNFRFTIISQKFPGDWDRKEQWYGTEYKLEKIPTGLMRELEASMAATASQRPSALHLPGKNEFVPSRLDVEKKTVKEPSVTPTLIRNDGNVRVWFKKDDQFWAPKANTFIRFRTPLASSTPLLAVLSSLFTALVQDDLEGYAYDAEIAGLGYSLSDHASGMDIDIGGYNDKMSVLLEKVLTSMRDLEIKQERFDIIKERLLRQYKNHEYQDPFRQISGYSEWLLRERMWINEELLEEITAVTAQDVRAFVPQLLRQFHIEILVHGNFRKDEALQIGNLVESTLRPYRLSPKNWPARRVALLPPGSNHIYQRTLKNPDNVNHCLEYIVYVGPNIDRTLRAKVLLFEKMAEEPCFDILRTKEQLGYVVFSMSALFVTQICWRMIIQSERDCNYLEQRCDAFLMTFERKLRDMSEEEFNRNKVGLINKRLEKLKNLSQETQRFWTHITNEALDFEIVYKDVAEIERLTKQDIIDFFRTYIAPDSPTRSKLSVHLIAQGTSADAPEAPAPNGTVPHTATNGASPKDHEHITNGVTPAPPTTTNGTSAKQIPAIVIEDVKAWRDSMALSSAPRPIKDLKAYEEVECKL